MEKANSNYKEIDCSSCKEPPPIAEKLATEVYDACFANSPKQLQVPILKPGENRKEDGEVPLSSMSANNALTKLYMDARKSMGKVESSDESVGSGFFIDNDGLFATDYHVIEFDDDKTVEVRTDDGVVHKATIVACDEKNDLALLKVEKQSKNENFHAVALAPFDESKTGQEFLSCGFGEEDSLHCSTGIYDRSVLQKEIKMKSTADYLDPERKLAHLKQHTETGDSGGLEFLVSDGTVRLLVDMTDGSKNTLAMPAQYLIALKDRYLQSNSRTAANLTR